ncbi:hypothetical protein I4U23_023933 [Adineta vaga]|nr:hypothetical protein I4U23_023933 [Adineta vaga]
MTLLHHTWTDCDYTRQECTSHYTQRKLFLFALESYFFYTIGNVYDFASMEAKFIVFAIMMAICLISVVDTRQSKRVSNDLFGEKLLDLLLEAKRRGLFDDKSQESQEEHQKRVFNRFDDEDMNRHSYVRRKFVGLSDDPI